MKSKMRRIYAAVMALAITISLVTVPVQAAEAPQFSDVDGHWGEEAIVRWADYGVIEGSNGQFNPDAPITRAEMAAAIARLLGLTETAENTFTDVEAGAWYAQAILQCAAAGIIQGSNGMANPNGTLTRQEAAVMLGRALGIQPDEGDVAFLDGEQVADWAAGYVSAMSDRGILSGVGGNQFAPLEDINRASVVTVLNNAITAYANEPGATVQASGGIALVVAEDVTVTGTAEDVLIVAGGDVTVAADVSGSVTVSAEGADVTVAENAVVGTVAVSGGSAAVTVEADASVSTLAVAESASGASVTVAADAAVETVTVAAPESSVTVSGSVGAVEAAETAGNADITVGAGATVDSITTAAAETDITVSGTVETVTVAGTAGSTTVTANRGAEITSVDNSAEDVTISGSGTVERVTTSGNDTAINTDGTELTVAEGVTGVTENNKDVDAGETTTTKRPSSGGGGSSSGGGSTHSHSYTDGVCSCGAYDPAWAQVDSAEDWAAAVAAGQNIVVTAAFTADTQLNVPGAITVNGRNLTITSTNDADDAEDAAGILVTGAATIKNLTVSGPNSTPSYWDNGEYGIKIYNADNVTLQNVTVMAANAGIQVNSSTVTLAGTVTVSGNEWGGIEVCKSSNEGLTAGILNINGATVVCTDTAVPAIWIDGTTAEAGVVNGADGMTQITAGDQIYYYTAGTAITLAKNATISGAQTVENMTVNANVTLTVSEGSTLTVTGTLTNNGTITGAGTVVASGYARQNGNWVKLFDAGLGTEADPYMIASNNEFAAMINYAGYDLDHAKNEYFKIKDSVTEIDFAAVAAQIDTSLAVECFSGYTGYKAYISEFQGNLDGNGKTLTNFNKADGYFAVIYTIQNGEIKNLDLNTTDGTTLELCYNVWFSILDDVDIYATETIQTGNNFGRFAYEAQSSTIKNCDNYANISGTYFAPFIGYTAYNTTFENCNNWAQLNGTDVGVLIGNLGAGGQPTWASTLTVTDCHNYGYMYGSNGIGLVTGNPGKHEASAQLNEEHVLQLTASTVVVDVTYTGTAIAPLVLNDFAISQDGKITQTSDTNADVSYYRAVYTGYARQSAGIGGTLFINVYSEDLQHNGSDVLDSGFKTGCKMIDFAHAADNVKAACANQWIEDTENVNYDKYAIVEVDGITYCVINFTVATLTIDTTATLVARAYDADGNMLTQVSVSE